MTDPEASLFPGMPGGAAAYGLADAPCGCWTCISAVVSARPFPENLQMPFIACPDCGNKRCPKATHHDNECTDSNEPNQTGSRYGGLDEKETS